MVQRLEEMEAEKVAIDKQKKRAELVALEDARRMERANAMLARQAEDLQDQVGHTNPWGGSPASKTQ